MVGSTPGNFDNVQLLEFLYQVTSYSHLFFLSGTGQGLVTNTSILAVTGFFRRRLGAVMGILFTVMALGGIVTPLILAAALDRFPGRSVTVGYGISILVGVLGAALFKDFDSSNDGRFSVQELTGTICEIKTCRRWGLLALKFY